MAAAAWGRAAAPKPAAAATPRFRSLHRLQSALRRKPAWLLPLPRCCLQHRCQGEEEEEGGEPLLRRKGRRRRREGLMLRRCWPRPAAVPPAELPMHRRTCLAPGGEKERGGESGEGHPVKTVHMCVCVVCVWGGACVSGGRSVSESDCTNLCLYKVSMQRLQQTALVHSGDPHRCSSGSGRAAGCSTHRHGETLHAPCCS